MKILIDKTELENSKWSDLIPLECKWCHNTFYKKKHHLQTLIKSATTKGKYCSQQCKGLARQRRTPGQCKQCGKAIIIKPSRLLRGRFQFCGKSCKATYWNSHKTTGSSRSKLEKWIEEKLTQKYPSLHIEYNKTTAINAELDIYIPSLKLAFELNGIFHYEPIFGEKKLIDTKTNDTRKFRLCIEQGIGLCIIDTHNAKYLKLERDQKFLDIIINIIDENLVSPIGLAPTRLST